MRTEIHKVAATTPGLTYEVPVLTFGTGDSGRKVYIQAGLHADEAPGMIAAQMLRQRLAEADRAGNIRSEILLVPMANPIGLGQIVLGGHAGRFDLADGVNFNRDFADLAEAVAERIEGRLGSDLSANRAVVKAAFRDAAAEAPAETPAQDLKRLLLTLAADADLVLDLHCDGEAVVHLYTQPEDADALLPLAALLGAEAVLVAEESGGHPFDEAISRPWGDLQRRFPDRPLGRTPATTVELRGRTDTAHTTASADAAAIFAYLTLAGYVEGPIPDVPPARCAATPLEGSEALRAPCPGIVVYAVDVGQRIGPGAVVAWIVDPATGIETAVTASTEGVLFARSHRRMAETGMRLGKIAGTRPFRSGKLLSP